MAFTKGIYYKNTKTGPKIYVPLQHIGKFMSIYPKGRGGVQLIRSEMKDVYMENGFKELDAAKFAKECRGMFWLACERLNERGEYPFILKLHDLDVNLLKNDNNTNEGARTEPGQINTGANIPTETGST